MLRRLLLPLVLCLVSAAPVVAQQAPIVVYLVRHAERAEDGTDDSPISTAGEQRARLLADMLRDAALTHIHTTDYLRTRATAAPVAREMVATLGGDPGSPIEPDEYDRLYMLTLTEAAVTTVLIRFGDPFEN